MRRNLFLILVALLPVVASADDTQELTVSDIEFIDEGYNEPPMIILSKEGSALNVHLMNYSAHPDTEEFIITPKMSGGSDGELCSVSIGVSYINYSETTVITTFNVSFNVHGIEANSFYFSCWWYKGMVSLTEGEPLELWENKNISKDGVIYALDNKTKTATLSSGRHVEGEYNIPSEVGYGGQTFLLTSIDYPAFAFNTSLTSVIVPQSVTNIGNAVFYRCSNLSDVYCYAENVPETGINVFEESNFTSATLHVPAGSVDKYKSTSPWNGFGNIVALPVVANEYIDPQTNVVYIYEVGQGTASVKVGYEEAQSTGFEEGEVFSYPGSPDAAGDIVILDRFTVGTEEYVVTRIGEWAFRDNSKIKSVSIPETVTDIGPLAFLCCDSLTSVQLPSGLMQIAQGLFRGCSQLVTVNIPSSVSTIGDYAFAGCGSLANITLPESLTNIGKGVFNSCYFVLDSFINKSTLTSSNNWGATLCDRETIDGLMLKDNAVVFCRPWPWVTSVTIPNGVTSIGRIAFMDCSGLTSVTIPGSVTSIGEYAFLRCYGLSSITIPNSVTQIGHAAFFSCYGLTSVTIGSGMTSIGVHAFYECKNLRNFYCYAENVPNTGVEPFESILIPSATLHVPAGSVDKYKSTSPWSDFGSIVAIEPPVTYTQGQMATIILPTTPDAKMGKYYRLDRCEDGKIIFEQELQPQARTPYIIVPKEDFSIDPNTLDLIGLSCDTVSMGSVSFIGSYSRKKFDCQEGWYIDIIDTTTDCQIEEKGLEEVYIIGALRAYLMINWDDPINHPGTKGPKEKLEIVLHDYSSGLTPSPSPIGEGIIFDLQGRQLFGKPQKGIFIEGGKKKVK